ncbi:immunoglobulin-like domain-containing protein, partial [Phocaeicola barnesiae]|uniref:immunoglobulin-like domain-containing protein n=1 Tax=Phocaeicola barnesiae TaxID=376804 RepID=UPI001D893D7D|nr:energy transducer TonB [Phocaeicola barnesiae]
IVSDFIVVMMKTKRIYKLLLLMAGCVSFISCTGIDKSRQNKLPEKTVPKVTHAFEETNDTLVEQNDDTTKDSVSVVSQPVTMVLKPIVRDIPSGLPIDTDSLSMYTEHDSYPVSVSEVKLFITNHTKHEFEGGEEYSLVYYDEVKRKWELQPTAPIVNSVLWLFSPDHPSHQQNIRFYTDGNRPGRYRIYKSFNSGTRTAYAELELVPEK